MRTAKDTRGELQSPAATESDQDPTAGPAAGAPIVRKSRVAHNNKVPPDAPRRNLSSFVMFANSRRRELRDRDTDRSYPELQTIISEEWHNMEADTKEGWRRAMEEDKERYRTEMALYKKFGSGWVWVVGHKMRQKMGLTDHDCTKLSFDLPKAKFDPSNPSTKAINHSVNAVSSAALAEGSSQGLIVVEPCTVEKWTGISWVKEDAEASMSKHPASVMGKSKKATPIQHRRQVSIDLIPQRVGTTGREPYRRSSVHVSGPIDLSLQDETRSQAHLQNEADETAYWDFVDPEAHQFVSEEPLARHGLNTEIISPSVFDTFGFEVFD